MRKCDFIEKIRAGHPLICEHDEGGVPKYMVAGHGIAPKIARGLIAKLNLVSQRDMLFETLEPQSWRLP